MIFNFYTEKIFDEIFCTLNKNRDIFNQCDYSDLF